jgi:hypothetical protein
MSDVSAPAQAAAAVLLVRPQRFGFNPDTAASNRFQSAAREPPHELAASARAEHDALVASLRAAGVDARVVEDTDVPMKPDAVFPNNWFSTHADGTVILYPMEAPSRRPERRRDVVAGLAEAGFRVARVLDLSFLEERGLFLEGTGSLVLDHAAGVAYAALSSRTHAGALAEFARATGLETVAFATRGPGGAPLYHTNVMLAIGSSFAVVCPDAIADAAARRAVLARLAAGGRELIEIDAAQVAGFAGNVLEVATPGGPVIAMSTAAQSAFGPALLARLGRHGRIVAVPVPVIERAGGGSVRCTLAEIFLPRTPSRSGA